MERVCAWCKKNIRSNTQYSPKGDITHGICSQCMVKITTDEQPRSVAEILDYVQEPVFLMDSEGTVRAANESGIMMVGKRLEQIVNMLGGDVFECSYAKEDDGCGKTVHCKTCAIRNTVMDTLSTSQGYKNIPAFQSIDTKDGSKILRFHISTEKVGENILLKIDQVFDRINHTALGELSD